MDRVFSPAERPFSEIGKVAVAITAVDEAQRHVGILHREESAEQEAAERISFLHLAWHLILKNDEPKPYYAWADPSIPALRAVQVAARCRQIYRANSRGIPYAFSPPNDCFDERTSEYLFGPTRHGLTCATFVLAVFQSAGIVLILPEGWPSERPGDEEWKAKVIDGLRNGPSPATEDHIASVEGEKGITRYRPEDVIGAVITTPHPASFEKVSPLAEQVLKKLQDDRLCVPPRAERG